MLGDYYPPTPYNLDPDRWIAWQFDHPGLKGGFVQAFRRENSSEVSQTYSLRGLDPQAKYTVISFDGGDRITLTGQDLMEQGLTVEIKQPRDAALIRYQQEKT